MPRETSDEQQAEIAAYLADDPNTPPLPLEPKTIRLTPESGQGARPDGHDGQTETRQETNRRPAAEPRPSQDDAAAELRRQLDLQRQATVRAEAAARDAVLRAAQAEHGRTAANVAMIDAAIDSAVRASSQAAARGQAALDLGDHKTAMEAQVELNDARHNLLRLQEQKAMVEEDIRLQRQQAQQPQPRQQPPQQFDPGRAMDAITAQLAQTGYVRSAQWLRQHPEFVSSPQMIDRVDAAHREAVNLEGLRAESDEYFDHIERRLGIESPAARQPSQTYGRGVGARAAAPVSSAAPSLRDGRTRSVSVHLSPAMRDHAQNVLGMDDEEYARELERARAEGKLLGVRS